MPSLGVRAGDECSFARRGRQRRVARIENEGRVSTISTRAVALVETFLRTQARREQFLQGLLRRFERNPNAKLSRAIRGRSNPPRARAATKEPRLFSADSNFGQFCGALSLAWGE